MSENPKFIKVKVYANSKKNAIISKGTDAFEIFVKAKARGNIANTKAIILLAEKLGENPKKLKIIKGSKSPNKIIRVL